MIDNKQPETKQPEPKPDPPEFISELDCIAIEENGFVLDTFTGRTVTREDLDAYRAKTA